MGEYGKGEFKCNYYRINVAKDGAYLFATEAVGNGGGGITSRDEAYEVIQLKNK